MIEMGYEILLDLVIIEVCFLWNWLFFFLEMKIDMLLWIMVMFMILIFNNLEIWNRLV